MKNLLKLIGLLILICFSFFYTDKVIEVIQDEDKIMIELKKVKDSYYVAPIDAKIVSNTIIPGISGREVNIDKSYKNMKETGIFNENLIIYDEISPSLSLNLNKDKYIIAGNEGKNMVSLIFILESDMYLEKINKILDARNVEGNFFVDYTYLLENSTLIKKIDKGEFYSYGNHGKYTPDNLLFSNNLISRIRDNEAIFCLAQNMEKDILKLCSSNDLYTIVPNIVGGDSPYSLVKSKLESGSIILLSMSNNTVTELAVIIDYILGKGYKIGTLSDLINE